MIIGKRQRKEKWTKFQSKDNRKCIGTLKVNFRVCLSFGIILQNPLTCIDICDQSK